MILPTKEFGIIQNSILIFIIIFLDLPVIGSDKYNNDRLFMFPPPEKRLALIIGNSAYQIGQTLKNPVNDAKLMAETLSDLSFEVIVRTDLGKQEMETAIKEFTKKMPGYNVILFYYAGHGIQIDGINYLIPVDAILQEKSDCRFEAVSINLVVEEFEKYPDNTNIVILDACRSNPFRSWGRGGNMEENGFRAINPSSGTIIAFATSEGATASDGYDENGLFTEELTKQMTVAQPIESVFKKTRIEVEKKSKYSQSPQEWSKLKGEFWFTKMTPDNPENITLENLPQKDNPENAVETVVAKPKKAASNAIYIASGPDEGTHQLIANDIKSIMDEKFIIRPLKTSGSIENIAFLASIDTCLMLGIVQYDAYTDQPKNIRDSVQIIMPLFNAQFHLITLKDSPIHKIEDCQGLKIATGPVGSGTRMSSQRIQKIIMRSWIDIPKYPSDVIRDLREKKVDAVFFVGGAPINMYAQFPKGSEYFIRLVDIQNERLESIYVKDTIEKGIYDWLLSDVQTYSTTTYLVADKNIGDEEIKAVVSSILDNLEALTTFGHPMWKDFKQNIRQDINNTKIPISKVSQQVIISWIDNQY